MNKDIIRLIFHYLNDNDLFKIKKYNYLFYHISNNILIKRISNKYNIKLSIIDQLIEIDIVQITKNNFSDRVILRNYVFMKNLEKTLNKIQLSQKNIKKILEIDFIIGLHYENLLSSEKNIINDILLDHYTSIYIDKLNNNNNDILIIKSFYNGLKNKKLYDNDSYIYIDKLNNNNNNDILIMKSFYNRLINKKLYNNDSISTELIENLIKCKLYDYNDFLYLNEYYINDSISTELIKNLIKCKLYDYNDFLYLNEYYINLLTYNNYNDKIILNSYIKGLQLYEKFK